MQYQWNNEEQTILSMTDASGHVVIIEPDDPRWDAYATRDDIAPYVPPPPMPEPVPASITMRQCRLQLHATGKLPLVDAAIAALPEPMKTEAQIEWEYGSVVWRTSPLIAMLAPVLGWDTSEAIDQQFIEAAAR